MTNTQKGGAPWELGKAATRMVQALVAGDVSEIEQAMSDYAAALGSQATSSMAAIAAPLMTGILDLRAAIAKLDDRLDKSDARADRSDRARLDRNTQFQTDMDTRLDVVVSGQDRIEQTLAMRRHAVDDRLDNHEGRIARIEQHLGLAGDGNP